MKFGCLFSYFNFSIRTRSIYFRFLVLTSVKSEKAKNEQYDLVQIKPTESEAEHWFCLWLRRLWSSENWIVGVASRSGSINQCQYSTPGLTISCFFRFCFRLQQPSFHWIISDGVVRNGKVLILPTLIPSSLWLHLRLRFSMLTRSQGLLRPRLCR